MTRPASGYVVRPEETANDRIWSDRARSYGWDTDATLASRLKLDLVQKYTSKNARLCDVGCGNGLFMRVLASQCAHITGVDLNADMLAEAKAMVARERLSNVDLLQCSASELRLPDASFDLVYCFSTLLLIPDIDAALAHMVRVLSRGGHLILDVAGRNNLSAIYWTLWYRRQGHFGLHAFSYPSFKKKIEALGCRVVESHALGFCDQWRYVPGLHLIKPLDRVFHASPRPDSNLDYRISNMPGVFRLANRWYVVARKELAA
jgi:SAM-dependent methyltransferase